LLEKLQCIGANGSSRGGAIGSKSGIVAS